MTSAFSGSTALPPESCILGIFGSSGGGKLQSRGAFPSTVTQNNPMPSSFGEEASAVVFSQRCGHDAWGWTMGGCRGGSV